MTDSVTRSGCLGDGGLFCGVVVCTIVVICFVNPPLVLVWWIGVLSDERVRELRIAMPELPLYSSSFESGLLATMEANCLEVVHMYVRLYALHAYDCLYVYKMP